MIHLTSVTSLFVWAWVCHLIADWLLQNEWQALNKVSLRHLAAYVHSGIHTFLLLFVFPPFIAVEVGVTHILIDTRVPLSWWGRLIKQTDTGPMAVHVAIWRDQIVHVVVLAIAAVITHYFINAGH